VELQGEFWEFLSEKFLANERLAGIDWSQTRLLTHMLGGTFEWL
jgi:hypothetical protein